MGVLFSYFIALKCSLGLHHENVAKSIEIAKNLTYKHQHLILASRKSAVRA